MEITPATPTPAPAPTLTLAPPAAATDKADQGATPATEAGLTGAPAGDFQTFLTLLTVQLRNQDPLKPMESTEFVAQLASFSAVEQQIRANDRLEQIFDLLSGGTADGLAQWIGKEVRAPAKGSFAGVPVDIEVTPLADADRAVLVVRNDFDQVVARRAVEPDAGSIAWDGADETGAELAHGRYGFALESYRGETLLDTQAGRVFGRVTEVRIEAGAPVLVLEGGAQVKVDEVSALR